MKRIPRAKTIVTGGKGWDGEKIEFNDDLIDRYQNDKYSKWKTLTHSSVNSPYKSNVISFIKPNIPQILDFFKAVNLMQKISEGLQPSRPMLFKRPDMPWWWFSMCSNSILCQVWSHTRDLWRPPAHVTHDISEFSFSNKISSVFLTVKLSGVFYHCVIECRLFFLNLVLL